MDGGGLVDAKIHNTQQRGKRRPECREHFLCSKFSCLAIKYEFYFTQVYSERE